MPILKFPLLYAGSKGEKNLNTLFDSGANLSCIAKEHLDKPEEPVHPGGIRKSATAGEGRYIEISERVTPDFYINDVLLSDEFLVFPNLSGEAIIGAAALQKWRIRPHFEHDKVMVDPKVAKLQLI